MGMVSLGPDLSLEAKVPARGGVAPPPPPPSPPRSIPREVRSGEPKWPPRGGSFCESELTTTLGVVGEEELMLSAE